MPQPLAIVTGASSGIGHAVATLLASRRYRTILIARRAERLRQLASELASHAPSVAVPLDLSDTDAVAPAAAALVAEHGPVDVLVNNAGRGLLKPFLDQSPEELDWMMRVHYFA
ncbi:MAG: SDR family NAD(P)-dependent oxidoreductase, partial [Phycisphaeraceae bacterium]